MPDGNHEFRTAWGFLAVRTNGLARYPGESDQWWVDRVTILQALGVLDLEGQPTPVENRLFAMHLKHRMRAFQGAFHNNPDYTLWYGWNEMVQDLDEIRHMAAEMREKHKSG